MRLRSFISQEKEKDGTTIVGNLISLKTKSRLSKENKEVTVRLYYDERGLDKYYGLLELGELGGMWKNVAQVDMKWMVRRFMQKRSSRIQTSTLHRKF